MIYKLIISTSSTNEIIYFKLRIKQFYAFALLVISSLQFRFHQFTEDPLLKRTMKRLQKGGILFLSSLFTQGRLQNIINRHLRFFLD